MTSNASLNGRKSTMYICSVNGLSEPPYTYFGGKLKKRYNYIHMKQVSMIRFEDELENHKIVA